MKLCGLVLVFLAALSCGLCAVEASRERVKLLLSLHSLLLEIETELSIGMPLLWELFESSKNERARPITKCMAESLRQGKTPKESALIAFSVCKASRLLSHDEREYLAEVFAGLGQCDLDAARRLLDTAKTRLSQRIIAAEEHARQSARVQLSLAVYAGAAAVIILM